LATIKDVALAAQVSTATVSRVYTGSSTVDEDTTRRVLDAAARLDYWPNAAARALTTSRTHALGVLLPDLYGEFFSEVIRGIDQAARASKLQVLLSGSHADTDALISAARSLRGRVDGLIVMAPHESTAAAIARLLRIFPMVLLNSPSHGAQCHSISIANHDGARTLVRHFLSLGHRRVAAVLGPPGNVDAEERRQGYCQALLEAKIDPDPSLEIAGDFTEASGYAAADPILRASPRPTAVFATNDSMAIGLLGGLRDRGLNVPGGMAVAGFDDIAVARYVSPPLTTVQVDSFALGRRAVALWEESARRSNGDGDAWVHEVIPATLVVRTSCGGRAAVLDPRTNLRGQLLPSNPDQEDSAEGGGHEISA
jgi:LacI family transcriptional regulator